MAPQQHHRERNTILAFTAQIFPAVLGKRTRTSCLSLVRKRELVLATVAPSEDNRKRLCVATYSHRKQLWCLTIEVFDSCPCESLYESAQLATLNPYSP